MNCILFRNHLKAGQQQINNPKPHQHQLHQATIKYPLQKKLFNTSRNFLFALILFNGFPIAAQAAQPNSKLDAYQDFFNQTNITDETSARAFLKQHAQRYQLDAPDTLKFVKQQPSLFSRHYIFQQTYQNLPVDRAEIIVSIDNKTNRVVRVYNNTQILLTPPPSGAANTATIPAQRALENVWQHQLAGSELLAKPRTRLVYSTDTGYPRLVYRINLLTSKQPGNWEYTVDASSGDLLHIERLDTPAFMPKDFQRTIEPAQVKTRNNNHSYESALASFSNKNLVRKKVAAEETRVNGTALLFDPDPVTALQNLELTISSPLAMFDNAYLERPLKDITLAGGVYQLRGPWVTIEDKEIPNTNPSTTTDGNWRAKRNETAFQDAMAYFHIDQSQRYIQSLGFNQETGIQYAPISVDAQGAFGMHNAFYSSFGNLISFGVATDCPAMAEDADVILHEYGHAIHYSINPNWYGGDTGAMGEGFADYWAGSYGLTTTNGATFFPERMGNWIAFNSCWPDGRLLTRTDTRYLKGKIYEAHEKVGDYYSDELWSAPLFLSLRTLIAKGIAREEVDRIILEAHFGLSSGITMTEMAKAIVLTARQMYPQGPHAEVFRTSFIAQHILPDLISLDSPALFGTQNGGIIQRDSTLGFNLMLRNNSDVPITNIQTQFSSTTQGITLSDAVNAPATLDADSSASLGTRVAVAANSECGKNLELQANIRYTDPRTQQQKNITQQYVYLIGKPVITRTNSTPNLKVPATSEAMVTSELEISGLPINADYFKLHLDLRIPLFSYPSVVLQSPAGTRIPVTNLPRFDTLVQGTAPDDFGYSEMFVPLAGENPNGIWKLEIKQPIANAGTGLLKSWGISTLTGADCATAGTTEALELNALEFSNIFLPVSLPGAKANALNKNNEFSKGNTVNVDYVLQNNSQQLIDNVEIALGSSVAITQERQSPPIDNLPALSAQPGKFQFAIPTTAECGSAIPLSFNYSYTLNGNVVTKTLNRQINVGVSFTTQSATGGAIRTIPDNDLTGFSETISVEGRKAFNADNTSLRISLEHSNPADLSILLRSPQGTEIELIKPGNTLPTYINDRFPQDIAPATPLARFNGENPNGIWTVTIKDTKADNTGSFHWIGMETRNERDCDRNNLNSFPTAVLNSNNFEVTEGQSIVIDASGSSDPDGDTLSFSYEQIAGPTQLLTNPSSAKPGFTAPEVSETTEFSYVLKVKDYYGFSSQSTFAIRVNNRAVTSAANSSSPAKSPTGSGGGGGGSAGLLLMILMAAGLMRPLMKSRPQ